MANWFRYGGPGYYVLFAIWVTGIVDIVLNLVAPNQHHVLSFGGADILYAVPVAVLVIVSFIVWLRITFSKQFIGHYVLFGFWVAGVIDDVLRLAAPRLRNEMFFGRAGFFFVPVGVLAVFSFILWLTWNKYAKYPTISDNSTRH
jgi:hypothetical protein